MEIRYTDKRNFTKEQVEELFLSVNWESGKHPARLYKALQNCEAVFTAWDGERLVGLANAIDDGAMTATFTICSSAQTIKARTSAGNLSR